MLKVLVTLCGAIALWVEFPERFVALAVPFRLIGMVRKRDFAAFADTCRKDQSKPNDGEIFHHL
ncbi:hypothetical protein GCM10007881_30960 [Mesorhizobium huakuii]|nr:hypothetical protein GCM10007881_30960 [Mesorhizobium huakuii]